MTTITLANTTDLTVLGSFGAQTLGLTLSPPSGAALTATVGGLLAGNATGGNKGTGTLNLATDLYINGTSVSFTQANLPGILNAMTAAFPSSFGATPTSLINFQVGTAVPQQQPQGCLQGMNITMTIPGTYLGVPFPGGSAYTGYVINANTVSANSSALFFGLAGTSGNGANCSGVNVIATNQTKFADIAALGSGYDFQAILGIESDINIYKKGGAAPAGVAYGFYAAGQVEAAGMPLSGFYAYAVAPLLVTGGGGVLTPWTAAYYTQDGAATYGLYLGTTAAGNSVGSQSIILLARDAGGVSRNTVINTDLLGNLQLNGSVSVWTTPVFGIKQLPPAGISATLWAHNTTNENIVIQGHQGLATGAAISAVNDANAAFVPMEIRGSQFCLTGGSVGIGTGASAPATTLEVVGSFKCSSTAAIGGQLTLTGQTNSAAAVTPTLGTSAPTGVSTPTFWLRLSLNGTTSYIPVWS